MTKLQDDELDRLLYEYYPLMSVTANDSKDDELAELAKNVLSYRRGKFKEAMQKLLADAENRGRIEELEHIVGFRHSGIFTNIDGKLQDIRDRTKELTNQSGGDE